MTTDSPSAVEAMTTAQVRVQGWAQQLRHLADSGTDRGALEDMAGDMDRWIDATRPEDHILRGRVIVDDSVPPEDPLSSLRLVPVEGLTPPRQDRPRIVLGPPQPNPLSAEVERLRGLLQGAQRDARSHKDAASSLASRLAKAEATIREVSLIRVWKQSQAPTEFVYAADLMRALGLPTTREEAEQARKEQM